jgi:SOS-response transcriptional repressor LexA
MNSVNHPHLPGHQRRRAIRRFIRGFVREHGYPPTLREIGEAIGLAVSTVSYHLSILEADGFISRGPAGRALRSNAAIQPPARRPTWPRCR